MEGTQVIYITLVVLMCIDDCRADYEYIYMVSKPETISIPFDYETVLKCEMNINPDNFEWKFYPYKDPYNTHEIINLSNATYSNRTAEKHSKSKRKSSLPLSGIEENAGEYQCLAYYGAYVVASIPWRITLARMRDFPNQTDIRISVTEGNTVLWYCDPPESNPEAYIDYFKNGDYSKVLEKVDNRLLILSNVTAKDSGEYKCQATNTVVNDVKRIVSKAELNLNVVKGSSGVAPYFIMPQKRVYNVTMENSVFLECSAVGNPPPRVVWYKKNGELPYQRTVMVQGGLIIKNITSSDEGVYVCNYTNAYGTVSHHITLIYNEKPSVECYLNTTEAKQGDPLDLDCIVKGTPEPQIAWFLNGFSVNTDKTIEAIGNKINFNPVEKRHAGNLQCFARNSIGTAYSSISIKVIPISTSVDDIVSTPVHPTHHRTNKKSTRKPTKYNKPPKMIPPSKPTISRLNDESVVVRWSVPYNNGLPIQFFKVQFRELGPMNHTGKASKWKTTNADIPPNIKDYDVTNLKPDNFYRFRIAAVYSNNDNKLSPNSDKFYLRRLDFDDRNKMPIPVMTHTETINDTSIKIYWKCDPESNITIDGFYINYIEANRAGDYMKTTVDGANTTSFIITHLQADTVYEVKLQSFTSKSASDCSQIMKAKTGSSPVVLTMAPPVHSTAGERSTINQPILYIAISSVMIVLLGLGGLLFAIRRCKQSKNAENRDKTPADIQVDVGSKSLPRTNGCALTSNRMTITSNPLADADNKNQNIMEMSCLTSQNNNCSTTPTQSSTSVLESSPTNSNDIKKLKNRDKNKNNKFAMESSASRENYV